VARSGSQCETYSLRQTSELIFTVLGQERKPRPKPRRWAARPASTAYRTKKYIQRHKFVVVAVAAIALLLIAFGVMQAIELRRIRRERDRADRVTKFMTGMFKVSNPSEARGNAVTAREILDKSSKDIDTSLRKDPELDIVRRLGAAAALFVCPLVPFTLAHRTL
jgi:hypothetical protein